MKTKTRRNATLTKSQRIRRRLQAECRRQVAEARLSNRLGISIQKTHDPDTALPFFLQRERHMHTARTLHRLFSEIEIISVDWERERARIKTLCQEVQDDGRDAGRNAYEIVT